MIDLFVPGRLCLFGEHSDWAGKYRAMNSDIAPGVAIVTGINHGIYATAEKSPFFEITSESPELADIWEDFSCKMDLQDLKNVAGSGSFFSYCAGVASYMLEWYRVKGGCHIHVTKMDMPIKSGLSSSAAICVLVARAFNQLYDLNLSTMGEMNIAYWGELRTPSRCGRLDQACAFGPHPVTMTFDAEEVEVERLNINRPLYWVFSNLDGKKDTIKILSDLNRGYPFAQTEKEVNEHKALGEINQDIVSRAVEYMREGETEKLGLLMTEAQEVFDSYVAPMSPSQLKAPALHKILKDPVVKSLSFGGKGVGSQGDGSVQFLAKDQESQEKLVTYLKTKGLAAYSFTISPTHKITKAIIPVAGFGSRLYPETRFLRKEFFPIVDKDNLVKPAILILLEECLEAGIEEICLVLGSEEEREMYRNLFERPISPEHLSKLSPEKVEYESRLMEIGKKLSYAYQYEKKGFGDAVYKTVEFAAGDPVLLLLGDTLYESSIGKCCALQLIEAYDKYQQAMMSIHETPLSKVSFYGITSGTWLDAKEQVLNMSNITEKPSIAYAEEYLGVESSRAGKKYYSAFGSYIITPEVFTELGKMVEDNVVSQRGEIELTTALERVREKYGLLGLRIQGQMFDIGVPDEFRNTVFNFRRQD